MVGRRVEAVAHYLVQLLSNEPYRSEWLTYAKRPRAGAVSQAAVAQVLALYLWDAGLADERDRELPRELKDRVGRALRGEVLSPETLSHLIHAFAFDTDEVMELWARYGEAVAEPDTAVGPGHRTIMLHEFHYLGPTGLPERHRTVHVVKALVDNLASYPYLFDTDRVEVIVERGGTASELYQREDGLYGVDILFHRALKRGETASFEYHTKFKYTEAPASEFRRQALRRVENMELLVQFHRSKQPTRVWWASWGSREGALLDRHLVTPDPDGAVQQFMTEVENRIVGFTWEW